MHDLAIVGSGFGGSLTALVAKRLGLDVVLLERGAHPRFAIGESSTPMSNILVEQIARDFDLPRIAPFSRYGKWKTAYSDVGVGPKRGFSFYHHPLDRPFEARADRSDQLLLEASPHHDVGDTHWYRPDLDHFLVREAASSGVDFVDRVELDAFERRGDSVRLSGARAGAPFAVEARFAVDASGPRGFFHRALRLPDASFDRFPATQALFNHFEGVRLWRDAQPGADDATPPYPVDAAALHHVFDGGWMWVLRFDSGITSAGFALEDRLARELRIADGAEAWPRVLERLPSIREQFRDARPVESWRHSPRIAFRASRAGGPGWTMLPSAAASIDPLFSTGIPLTLLGVDRIGRAIRDAWRTGAFEPRMRAHEEETLREADAAAALVGASYRAFRSFPAFAGLAIAYLATVSFAEICFRLDDRERASGFLGARDASHAAALRECARAAELLAAAERLAPADLERYDSLVASAIEPRNVGGFADPRRRGWYPVDLRALIASASKLGRTPEEIRALLERTGMSRWIERGA